MINLVKARGRKLAALELPNTTRLATDQLIEEQQRASVHRSHSLEPRHRVLLGPRGGPNIAQPTRTRQGQRLQTRFRRLMAVASNAERLISLRHDLSSIAPERAIVFEVAGSLEDFYKQAQALGLEYLGDFEDDFEPTDDFYDRDHQDKEIGGRLYLAMPDVRALQQLLGLWRIFRENQRMPRGIGAWGKLF